MAESVEGAHNWTVEATQQICETQKVVSPTPANCIFCGAPDAMQEISFPETFTAYQLLQAGDKACSRCAEMFSDPKFRRNCWFMHESEWEKIEDPIEFLEMNILTYALPITLYFTKAKRKHGWVNAVQNPVLNTEQFILCVDEDKILFERSVFNKLVSFSRGLLNREIPKGVLLGGMPSLGTLHKFGLTLIEGCRLQELRKNQLWEMCVKFVKPKTK
jgi:hypothetical protein